MGTLGMREGLFIYAVYLPFLSTCNHLGEISKRGFSRQVLHRQGSCRLDTLVIFASKRSLLLSHYLTRDPSIGGARQTPQKASDVAFSTVLSWNLPNGSSQWRHIQCNCRPGPWRCPCKILWCYVKPFSRYTTQSGIFGEFSCQNYPPEVISDVISGVIVEPTHRDAFFVKYGDSKSKCSWDMTASLCYGRMTLAYSNGA